MRVHLIAVCLLPAALAFGALAEEPPEPLVGDEESLAEDYLEDTSQPLLDLNAATLDDLAALPRLTRRDAVRIVSYRRTHGPFRSPRDLARVEGLPWSTVEPLMARLTVGRPGRSEVASRLRMVRKTRSGPTFLRGAGLRSRTTWRSAGGLQAALSTDKDPGERSAVDFAAGYLEGGVPRWNARWVVGDFRPGFAEGLVLSRWSRSQASLDQVVRRSGRNVGSTSTDEDGSFRGVYGEVRRGPLLLASFASSSRWDAALDSQGRVDRLVDGGYHVTDTERRRADALRERALGLRAEWASPGGWHAGLTGMRSEFTPPFRTGPEFGPSGSSARAVGLDGGLSADHWSMAGEFAATERARAIVVGVATGLPNLKAGLQVRDYSPGYQALHGSGFSSFGESRNERGLFAGLSWRRGRLRDLLFTADRSTRPDSTATLPGGTVRTTLGFFLRHDIPGGPEVRWTGRARWDETWKGKHEGVVSRRKETLRVDLSHRLSRGIRGFARGEAVFTRLGSAQESGRSSYGGLEVRWRKVRLECRLTYFDLPSYESRLFEWEDAPEGMMPLRTLTGRGLKAYGLVSANVRGLRGAFRVWRQLPTDGRPRTTEFLAQLELRI